MKQLKYALFLLIGILFSCSDDEFLDNQHAHHAHRGGANQYHEVLDKATFANEAPVIYEKLLATNAVSFSGNSEYTRLQVMLGEVNKIEIDSLVSYTFEVKHLDYPDLELTENLIYTKYFNDDETMTLLRYHLTREQKQQLTNLELVDLSRDVGYLGTGFELNPDEHLYESFNMIGPISEIENCFNFEMTGSVCPSNKHTYDEMIDPETSCIWVKNRGYVPPGPLVLVLVGHDCGNSGGGSGSGSGTGPGGAGDPSWGGIPPDIGGGSGGSGSGGGAPTPPDPEDPDNHDQPNIPGLADTDGNTITFPIFDVEDEDEDFDDHIFVDEEFKENECLLSVYEDMGKATTFNNYLQNFDGDMSVSHLRFKYDENFSNTFQPEYHNAIAITEPPLGTQNVADYNINITFNGDMNLTSSIHNKPDLIIAVSFIHEMIHAEVFRKMLSAAQFGNLDPDNMTPQQQLDFVYNLHNNFDGIWDYYVDRWREDWGHQLMAEHYIDIIVSAVSEYDNNSHSLDTYKALAWVGLYDTIAWNNLLPEQQEAHENNLQNYIDNATDICD